MGGNICGTGCGYVGCTEGRSNHLKWGEFMCVGCTVVLSTWVALIQI